MEPYLISCRKINPRWNKEPRVKKMDLLNKKQKEQNQKKEINKSDYIKIKNFCSTKRQQNEQRKI